MATPFTADLLVHFSDTDVACVSAFDDLATALHGLAVVHALNPSAVLGLYVFPEDGFIDWIVRVHDGRWFVDAMPAVPQQSLAGVA